MLLCRLKQLQTFSTLKKGNPRHSQRLARHFRFFANQHVLCKFSISDTPSHVVVCSSEDRTSISFGVQGVEGDNRQVDTSPSIATISTISGGYQVPDRSRTGQRVLFGVSGGFHV